MKNQSHKYLKTGISKKYFSLKILLPFLILIISCSSSQKKDGVTKNDSTSVPVKKDSVIRESKLFISDCKLLLAEAKKMDSILLKEMEVKKEVANKAIKAFTDFAFYCTADTLCPIYLIKTAQVAQSVNNMPQAQVALEKCVTAYPKSTHRAAAMFLLAQLYDETVYLNNEQEAKKLYEMVIYEYPKSDWAKSAKGALNFIGKSDAQIMEELKKK